MSPTPGALTLRDGYSGMFLDTEGQPWEVAVSPGWPLDAEGRPRL